MLTWTLKKDKAQLASIEISGRKAFCVYPYQKVYPDDDLKFISKTQIGSGTTASVCFMGKSI